MAALQRCSNVPILMGQFRPDSWFLQLFRFTDTFHASVVLAFSSLAHLFWLVMIWPLFCLRLAPESESLFGLSTSARAVVIATP